MRLPEPPRGAQRQGGTQGWAPTGTRVTLGKPHPRPGSTARDRQLREAFLWGKMFNLPSHPTLINCFN